MPVARSDLSRGAALWLHGFPHAAATSSDIDAHRPRRPVESILWSTPDVLEGARPLLAALVCHPHPLFGGTMHNKVVYQAAKTIHGFGLPVVRFNFRGVGLSEGAHDNGRGEKDDVGAVIDFLAEEYPGVPLLLAGFSFGSWVGLRAGCGDPRVTRAHWHGPAGRRSRSREVFLTWMAATSRSFSSAANSTGTARRTNCARWSKRFLRKFGTTRGVAVIAGGDHFFAGHLPELDRTIADWLMERHAELRSRTGFSLSSFDF